jgi:sigma-B regulation protein RsbU (phosphoserine phosphatase)
MDKRDMQLLARLPFLRGARPEVLERLLESAIEKTFLPGSVILREGDIGQDMLLILEGSVEVVKAQGNAETLLAQRGAGEVFGEMGFIEARPRFATIRALTTTRLLEFSAQSMHTALSEQPELLLHTTQLLSARLREADQQMITDLQRKNEELERAYQELKEAQAALVEKERLERELELAHELQQSILPSHFPRADGFQCAARSRPARQVGGDFYDVIDLGKGEIGLVMADVSDKGMPAALYMALSRSLIRAEARRSSSPRQVLVSVNRLLLEVTRADMFVSVFYGVIDLVKGRLTYARAGHDRPILRRRPSDAMASPDCSFLTGRGIMLGMFDEVALDEVQVELLPGDVLVLYTDGVTDTNSPSGDFFGAERLMEVIRNTPLTEPQGLCDCIFDDLAQFQCDATQYDDTAVLVTCIGSGN